MMHRVDRRSRVWSALALTTLLIAAILPAAAIAAEPRGGVTARTEVIGDGRGADAARPLRRERVDPSARPQIGPDVPDLAPLSVDITAPTAAAPEDAPDPVQATISGAAAATHATTFTGLADDSGLEPPDPWVAVGPEHVFQAVNRTFRISDRTGTELATTSMFDFFGLSQIPGYNAAVFDPRVIYDSLHGRWVAIEASFDCYPSDDSDIGTGWIDIAISDSADALGGWTVRSIPYPDVVPDYPGLGTTTDKVILSANVFALEPGGVLGCAPGSGAFVGTEIDVLAWSELISDDQAHVAYLIGGPDFANEYFTWRPALQVPATSSTGHVIGEDIFGAGLAYTRITGSPAGGGITTMSAIVDLSDAGVVAPFAEPPEPIQPGSPPTIERAVDLRPTDAIWQNSRLSLVSTYPCDPDGGAAETRDCVRVTQLSTASPTPTLVQDFLLAEDGADLFMGGVGQALNGDLHVVWTRSSAAGGYPSTYAAVQPVGSAAGSISSPDLLATGTDTYPGVRWGDYVGVAQDPQVPNAVWSANEYSVGADYWATSVVQSQTEGSTYVPITPVRVLDSRVGVGVSGTFQASVPRDFVVAGFGGGAIPADATAVTANVTVTQQTAGGYVSVTTIKTATPPTSTINFPTGENRANNLTIPIPASGRLAAVYKAGTGKTTHLVMDVTGYFLSGDAGDGYTPVDPVRLLDSRFGTGLSGPFVANTPRKLVVAGIGGIPADAAAITANVTVVGQTSGGYVSVTPTSQPTPPTSTINFPTNDIRANGLTAKLDGGSIWLVYKAKAGATIHLILDVTGYYGPTGDGLAFFPLDPGRIMDTRSAVLSGLTGKFSANTPRKLDTDGHWGVPAGTKAVTGNLTVTASSAAGYVSGTPISIPAPTTSTLNFPKGENRANGITVPLGPTGDQYFVYRATSGSKTDLILDVTGYFR